LWHWTSKSKYPDNRGVSRLLFRRYLLPVSPWVLALPVVAVVLGLVLAVSLAGPAVPAPEAATEPMAAGSEAPPAGSRAPAGELRLTFLGDIMAHAVNFTMADYGRIYEHVRGELSADDITFANLETPVISSRPQASYPRFNVHRDYVLSAARAGVDALSIANNHTNDWGAAGIAETREELALLTASRGLSVSGLRAREGEPIRATLVEAAGRRVGFVAVTQFHNVPGPGTGLVYTADYRDEAAAESFLEWVSIHALGFDLFVVSYHGGREYVLEPDPRKARFFERLARAGADVVWSHHPHVVQPWRTIERADGSEALLLYSTGNFISGQTWRLGPADAATTRAHTGDSPLFRVHARWDAAGRLRLEHDPVLAANYRDPEHGMIVRPLDDLIRSDIDERWKRYYVVRRNALREVAWRSGDPHLAAAGGDPAGTPATPGGTRTAGGAGPAGTGAPQAGSPQAGAVLD
jgi:poly-gamma-glutamate synthesis protein (capsule biosynthesis protein)